MRSTKEIIITVVIASLLLSFQFCQKVQKHDVNDSASVSMSDAISSDSILKESTQEFYSVSNPEIRQRDSLVLRMIMDVNLEHTLWDWSSEYPIHTWSGVTLTANNSTISALNLSAKKISKLPKEIANLKDLKTLSLDNNLLEEFPIEIVNLKSLSHLTLNNNQIVSLPTEIKRLQTLQVLQLDKNYIEQFPIELPALINLSYVSLANNSINTVHPSIQNLKNLKKLDLSNNRISELPREVIFLPQLQTLNLSGNLLRLLPKEICHSRTITTINLTNNKFTTHSFNPTEKQWLSKRNVRWRDLVIEPIFNINSDDTVPYYYSLLPRHRETEISITGDGVIARDSTYKGRLSWEISRNGREVLSRATNSEYRFTYPKNSIGGKYTVFLSNNKEIVSNVISYETRGDQIDSSQIIVSNVNRNASIASFITKDTPLKSGPLPFRLTVDTYGTVKKIDVRNNENSAGLSWMVFYNGQNVLQRSANRSTMYQYFGTSTGTYTVYLAKNNRIVSNIIEYDIP